MEQDQKTSVKNRLKSKIKSLSLSKEDMTKFCKILQERASAAAEIEVQKFNRGNRSDEELDKALKTLREGFELKITIAGINGEELYGSIEDVFNSPNFPEQIKHLYVNSEHVLIGTHNYYPLNSFEIFLDFSKPSIFDFSLMPSLGTPNESNYEVRGYDATWANGVYSEITKFIGQRSSTLSRVHNHSVYDFLLWFFGFPIAFWTCFKLSNLIESLGSDVNSFVISAIYFYSFVATLFLFRILFHYLRWVCPLVEYKVSGNKIIAHRAFLALLATGILIDLITDVIKWVGK